MNIFSSLLGWENTDGEKIKVLISLILWMAALYGCGKSSDKYYQDTALEKFETFTTVTGIEVSLIQ